MMTENQAANLTPDQEFNAIFGADNLEKLEAESSAEFSKFNEELLNGILPGDGPFADRLKQFRNARLADKSHPARQTMREIEQVALMASQRPDFDALLAKKLRPDEFKFPNRDQVLLATLYKRLESSDFMFRNPHLVFGSLITVRLQKAGYSDQSIWMIRVAILSAICSLRVKSASGMGMAGTVLSIQRFVTSSSDEDFAAEIAEFCKKRGLSVKQTEAQDVASTVS